MQIYYEKSILQIKKICLDLQNLRERKINYKKKALRSLFNLH
ncbi:hypothetical protein NU08_1943 [Flavobacterium anhuiense]|uniref:Uncharacterized protein n=1 Tax=Flavobacterium anhuiense TaxID=459526 RepID=A0A444VZP5_9FLAO|nr:hypothetical protein NU08_1943 [Flavobacterium anhuiense]